MGKDRDPGSQATNSKDPKMQAAKIRLLDGTHKDFELHRGSDGEALFTLVSADLSIEEREYFSLCFYDSEGTRHWLYNDKKILRQLKGLPWEFCFEVKFYPTAPSSLNGDHARYNLFLQLRNDVCTGRLPATIDTYATLGSLVAQSEIGDAKPTNEYEQYLRSTKFAPQSSEQLIGMIAMKHKDHKGLTPSEAENLYMDTCKQLSMYGIFVFNARDNKNDPVGIGICAHGIYIYKEQIRVNRFPWQGIIKISYRKNQFAVKLKAGEIDKKEATVVYKVADYQHAKRIWKCAVEHHTFFRLIQPDEKPKSSLFRWGSARFRYQGRTQFQTKMASQMFDKPAVAAVQRASSARRTQSLDNVAKQQVMDSHVSSLHYADNELGSFEPMASPTACYDVIGKNEKSKLKDEVGNDLPCKDDDDDELVYTPVESPLSAAYYLSEYSSAYTPTSNECYLSHHLKFTPSYFLKTSDRSELASVPNTYKELGSDSLHFPSRQDHFSHFQINATVRQSELEQIPINDCVQVYHAGNYHNLRRQGCAEFVNSNSFNNQRNGVTIVRQLIPNRELDHHPIRYFVDMKHSGFSYLPHIRRLRHAGQEEVTTAKPLDYAFEVMPKAPVERLELSQELPAHNIRQYSLTYHPGSSHVFHRKNARGDMLSVRLVARVLSTSSLLKNPRYESKPYKLMKVQNETIRIEKCGLPLQIPGDKTGFSLSTFEKSSVLSTSRITEHAEATCRDVDTAVVDKYRMHLFNRWRHDGDEEIVDKDHVRPETYGLASTSYDGPLELTSHQSDLQSTPLEEHVQVYYHGQFPDFVKSTKDSNVEEAERSHSKNKEATMHLSSSPAEANHDRNLEDETPKIRLIARVPHSSSNEDSDSAKLRRKGSKNSSGFMGFWKPGSRKTHTDSVTLAAHPSSDKYVGPLDHVSCQKDIEQLPFVAPTPVPYSPAVEHYDTANRRVHLFNRWRHDGDEEVVEKDHVQPETYGLASTSYDGPLELTSHQSDLQSTPLEEHVQVYYHGQFTDFVKSTKDPNVEEAERSHSKNKEAIMHLRSSPAEANHDRNLEDEAPKIRLIARVPHSSSNEDSDSAKLRRKGSKNSSGFMGFWKPGSRKTHTDSVTLAAHPSSDKYVGPLGHVSCQKDIEQLPFVAPTPVPYSPAVEHYDTANRRVHLFNRWRHDGDEEVVEKDHVQPETDGLASTSYDGPLELTSYQSDIQSTPLEEHVQVYYHGQFPDFVKSTKDPNVEEAERSHSKNKEAIMHLRSSPAEANHDRNLEDETPKIRLIISVPHSSSNEDSDSAKLRRKGSKNSSGFMGFWKPGSRKTHTDSVTLAAHPSSDKYVGPLDHVSCQKDIEQLPFVAPTPVPYSPAVEHYDTANRRVHLFNRWRHDGDEEVVEKDHVQPETYGLASTSYDGPLELTSHQSDLQSTPLEEHVQVYYHGQFTDFVKSTKDPNVEEAERSHSKNKEAIMHLRSSPAEANHDRNLEDEAPKIRLIARVPHSSSNEDSDSAKLRRKGSKNSSGFMGFWKPGSRKTHTDSVTLAAHPSSDKYVGPLDHVSCQKDIEQLPFIAPTPVPYSPAVEHYDTANRRVHLFNRWRHDGDEEVVEKGHVRPETYGLASTSYDGPLELTSHQSDLQSTPLEEHVQVYYHGQFTDFVKSTKDPNVEEAERSHSKNKEAIMHLRSSPAEANHDRNLDDETPKIRLIARVPHSSSNEDSDSAKLRRKGSKNSSGFMGFWKPGSRKTHTDSVTLAAHPSSDNYVGPLDHVSCQKDIEQLPFIAPTPVPYSPAVEHYDTANRRVHLFNRWRHDGDEEVVEKDHVQPETYGLASTSYDGPLELTSHQSDLQSTPLEEHVQVYYHGQFTDFVKSTKDPNVEEAERSHSKNKEAIMHLRSSPAEANHDRNLEDEAPKIRLIARVPHSSSNEDSDSAKLRRKGSKNSSGFMGFWKPGSRKTHTDSVTLAAHPSSDKYVGPLDHVSCQKDIEQLPFIAPTPVPYSPAVEHYDTANRRVHLFNRWRHDGDEEVVEKGHVRPETYGLASTSYDGPLELTSHQSDLQSTPLEEHVQVYYHGQFTDFVKSTKDPNVEEAERSHSKNKEAIMHLRSSPAEANHDRNLDDETPKIRLIARVPHSSSNEDSDSAKLRRKGSKNSSGFMGFWKPGSRKPHTDSVTLAVHPSSDKYVGPLDHVSCQKDIEQLPFIAPTPVPYSPAVEHYDTANRRVHLFNRWRHDGDEEVVEKDHVRPETYGLASTSYGGPLELTSHQSDLQSTPLEEHVQVYYHGQFRDFVKSTKDPNVEEAERSHSKNKEAIMHLRSSPAEANHDRNLEDETPKIRLIIRVPHSSSNEDSDSAKLRRKGSKNSSSFMAFWKPGSRKPHTDSVTLAVHSSSDKYVGPLDHVSCQKDIEQLPFIAPTPVPYSPAVEHYDTANRRVHLFNRWRHDGDEEVVEKDHVRPETYGLASTSYDGPLELTSHQSDLQSTPLEEHVQVYYHGQFTDFVKSTKDPNVEEAERSHSKNKEAIMHLRSSPAEANHDRNLEDEAPKIRLIARVPHSSSNEDSDSAKLRRKGSKNSSGFMGFWKPGSRKTHTDSVTLAAHPSSDKYVGPLDHVSCQKDIEQLPFVAPTPVPYSPAVEHYDTANRRVHLFNRWRHDGDEEVVEKDHVQPETYGLASTSYDGPLELTSHQSDLQSTPLEEHVQVYYHGQFTDFVKSTKDPNVEEAERSHSRNKEAIMHLRSSPAEANHDRNLEDEAPKIRFIARVPHSSSNEDSDSAKLRRKGSKNSSGFMGFWKPGSRKTHTDSVTLAAHPSSDKYVGPLDHVSCQKDIEQLPFIAPSPVPYSPAVEHYDTANRRVHLFNRWRHDGDEEVVEKDHVRPETYGLASTSYGGPLELTSHQSDLQSTPLEEHVQVYYHGQFRDFVKSTKDPNVEEAERSHSKNKEAIMHLRSSPAEANHDRNLEDEAPKIRFIPRVPHSSSNEDSDSAKLRRKGSKNSSGFMGFWKPGSRKTHTDSVTLAAHPSSDKYVGPLDHVSCQKDIEQLPFIAPTPVPYSPAVEHYDTANRRVHLFNRWRHDGDEEVVEKGHVRPETYGLASTSYDGPLELTSHQSDLQSTPLEEHVQVYYHGQFTDFVKSTKDPNVEEAERSHSKNKEAIMHLRSSPAEANHDRNLDDETLKIRLIARVPHSSSNEDSDSAKLRRKGSKNSSGFMGFWKPGSRKPHTDSVTLAVHPSSDKYVGPLDHVSCQKDIEQLPFIAPTPVPYSPAVEHYDTANRRVHLFNRWRHDGDEEVVEKDHVRPETYGLASTSYGGPLELTSHQSDLQSTPLEEHVQVYYHGQFRDFVKSTKDPNVEEAERSHSKNKEAIMHLRSSPAEANHDRNLEDETPKIRLIIRVPHSSSNEDSDSAKLRRKGSKNSSSFMAFWKPGSRKPHTDSVTLAVHSSSDKYVGPLDHVSCQKDIEQLPFIAPTPVPYSPAVEHYDTANRRVHLFNRWRHDGDEEVVEKDHVRPETYGLASTSYDGPLELTSHQSDLQSTPLEEHVQVYYHGQFTDFVKSTKDPNVEEAERSHSKNKEAIMHLRSSPAEANHDRNLEDEAPKIRLIARVPHSSSNEDSDSAKLRRKGSKNSSGFMGFWKPGSRKTHTDSVTLAAHPSSDKYVGPLDHVSCQKDIEQLPFVAPTPVPYSPAVEHYDTANRRVHLFNRWRHDGDEEVVEKDHVQPETYGLASTSYDGPLELTSHQSDLQSTPLEEHVQVYYHGQFTDFVKSTKDPNVEEAERSHSKNKEAIMHLRSSPAEANHDRNLEDEAPKIRFIARVPHSSSNEDSDSAKLRRKGSKNSSGFMGFWKPGSRKTHTDSVTLAAHPSSDKYVGPLDHVSCQKDIEQLPFIAPSPVPYSPAVEHYDTANRRVHLFNRWRHDGDEEVVEKDHVRPETYGLASTSYGGPLELTSHQSDLQSTPLEEHVQVYYHGQFRDFVKSTKDPNVEEAERSHSKNKEAIMHLRSSPAEANHDRNLEDEAPKIRFIARVPHSSSNEDSDSAKLRRKGSKNSSGFMGFWKPGSRKTHTDSVTLAAHPSSDKYVGPLDHVSCQKDIEQLPFIAPSPVPYSPAVEHYDTANRRVHLFNRWRHDGDEEVVEKDHVRPETYGLASTSYGGPLELTSHQSDLQSTPLEEHVQVYYHGQFRDFVKSTKDPNVEEAERSHSKNKEAIMHLRSSPAEANHDRNLEDEAPKIRFIPRVPHSSSNEDSDSAKLRRKGSKNSSGFMGFWKPGSRKTHTDSVTLAAHPSSDKYVGPLDHVSCQKDIEQLPFIAPTPVPYSPAVEHYDTANRRVHLFNRWRHDGDEEVVEKGHVRPETYGLASTSYDGPLELTSHQSDLQSTPLEEHVQVYYHGQFTDFVKSTKDPNVEEAERSHSKNKEAIMHLRSSPAEANHDRNLDDETLKIRLIARVPHSSSNEDSDSAKLRRKGSKNSSGFMGFWKPGSRKPHTDSVTLAVHPSSDKYVGPLDHVSCQKDIEQLPFIAPTPVPYSPAVEHYDTANRRVHLFNRWRHDGDEEVVEKDHVRPETYGLASTSYGGPLELTSHQSDLQSTPLEEHVQVYYHGQFRDFVKSTKDPNVEEAERSHSKNKEAIMHLRSSPAEANHDRNLEDETPKIRLIIRVPHSSSNEDSDSAKLRRKGSKNSSSFMAFWKPGSRKPHTDSVTLAVHSSSDKYVGPLDHVSCQKDIEQLPFIAPTPVPYSPAVEHYDTANRRVHLFNRWRHDGDEEVVEKDHVRPETYGLASTSYDGPLELTSHQSDLQSTPLEEHVQVYYHGQFPDFVKITKDSNVEAAEHSHSKNKEAIMHLRSSPAEANHDRNLEDEAPKIRLIARVPHSSSNEDSDSAKLRRKGSKNSSGFMGFWKPGSRKTRTDSVTLAAHPSSDKYVGPLDHVSCQIDIEQLPFIAPTPVPYRPAVEHYDTANCRVHLFNRWRHDGDEEVVEKGHVRPETYDLASTSYDGPLELTSHQSDLQSTPLEEHVQVYYHGQSPNFVKSTKDSNMEEAERNSNKEKTVMHLRSSPAEDEKPKVRLIARILRKESGNHSAKVEATRDSSALRGFWERGSQSHRTERVTLPAYSTSDTYVEPPDNFHSQIKVDRLPSSNFLREVNLSERTSDVENNQVFHFAENGSEIRFHSDPKCLITHSSTHGRRMEGTTPNGKDWVEVRIDRRVELQLEPTFCLTKAGLAVLSEDDDGLIFTVTPPMASSKRSFFDRLGFKNSAKKPKKHKKGTKEADSSDSSSSSGDEKNQVHVMSVESEGVALPLYMDPNEKDGRVVRRETNELKYHLKGEGISPGFDPQNPSLASTIAEAERLNLRSPRLEHAERTVTVRALAPLPLSYEESGQPHTTISTWQESNHLPDEVTTEYDEKGNKITRTLKTSQVKHTVQKQTFQNYVVPPSGEPGVVTVERMREETTPLGLTAATTNGSVTETPHVVQTHTRSVAYDTDPNGRREDLGEFVSCKTLTSGNRTVETYTYKTERDGIIETHVEHRVTILSEEPIDHDAELSQAIMEATQMNPDMTVEKIEVRQETTA